MPYTLYKTVPFGPGRSGLATVGYTLTGQARATAGVTELAAGSGSYGALVTVPDGFQGAIVWDTGQGAQTVSAPDEINPGSENLDVKVSSRSVFAGGAVASVAAPVTVGTNNDKAGYALSAAGLDAVPVTPPVGPAATFREMVVQTWRRFFAAAVRTPARLQTLADDGITPVTTQAVTDDGVGNETQSAAT